MRIPIPHTDPSEPMSKAAIRREKARERAAASRASAKVRVDLDAAIADAVASLVAEQGRGGVPPHHLSWRLVIEEAYHGLRERDYDKTSALDMIRYRLIPDWPGAPENLAGVIEQL